jgi:hypothetical protein
MKSVKLLNLCAANYPYLGKGDYDDNDDAFPKESIPVSLLIGEKGVVYSA